VPHLILAALDPLGVILTILGLGALIFFHEFGHFLACLLTGTRVETFSIGFGPELLGWTRGKIRYRVAAIPLGGYVKMAAENPGEAHTDAPDEFPNKPFLQRLFIMSNGVIFNGILAFLLFVWAFGAGVRFQRAELGKVLLGEPGWEAGLEPGDLVTAVDGKPILGFSDLSTEMAFSAAGARVVLTVEREGRELAIPVEPRYSKADGMPVIRVAPALGSAAIGVKPGSPAAKAGGRAGDVVLSINGIAVQRPDDLVEVCAKLAGQAPEGTKTLDLTVRVRHEDKTTADLAMTLGFSSVPQIGVMPYEGREIRKLVRGSEASKLVLLGDELLEVNGRPVVDLGLLRERALRTERLESIRIKRLDQEIDLKPRGELDVKTFASSLVGLRDLRSSRIVPRDGMAAARAGLAIGDRLLQVGDVPVSDWNDIHTAISTRVSRRIKVVVEGADGKRRTVEVVPGRWPKLTSTPLGYRYQYRFLLHRETSIAGAVATGWRRTVLFTRSVGLTIRSLITRRVSSRNIGGPLMLASVTYRMLDLGWGRYFYILAIISINLAILNLLPIPVLDGGQIVLLCAEKLRGKPLPDRIVGYYQMVGLALILALLVLAFSNDIRTLF